jgi:hypothetical protein
MDTFTPVRGMLVCVNNTGDYVLKSDYDKVANELRDCAHALAESGCDPTKALAPQIQELVARSHNKSRLLAECMKWYDSRPKEIR